MQILIGTILKIYLFKVTKSDQMVKGLDNFHKVLDLNLIAINMSTKKSLLI